MRWAEHESNVSMSGKQSASGLQVSTLNILAPTQDTALYQHTETERYVRLEQYGFV